VYCYTTYSSIPLLDKYTKFPIQPHVPKVLIQTTTPTTTTTHMF
jgi:hypothetical protein